MYQHYQHSYWYDNFGRSILNNYSPRHVDSGYDDFDWIKWEHALRDLEDDYETCSFLSEAHI